MHVPAQDWCSYTSDLPVPSRRHQATDGAEAVPASDERERRKQTACHTPCVVLLVTLDHNSCPLKASVSFASQDMPSYPSFYFLSPTLSVGSVAVVCEGSRLEVPQLYKHRTRPIRVIWAGHARRLSCPSSPARVPVRVKNSRRLGSLDFVDDFILGAAQLVGAGFSCSSGVTNAAVMVRAPRPTKTQVAGIPFDH